MKREQGIETQYRAIGFWIMAAIVLGLAFQLIQPFLVAILGGIVLSVLTYPVYRSLLKRMSPILASLTTVGVTLLMGALPLVLVGVVVTLQVRSFVKEIEQPAQGASTTFSVDAVVQRLDGTLKPFVEQTGSDFSAAKWYDENRREITRGLTTGLTRAGVQTGIGLLLLVMAFLCMFFMLKDGHKLLEPALDLIPLARDEGLALLERLRNTVVAVFFGVVLVAFIQGTLATFAYMFAGVEGWLVWGAATVVCAAIPVLGAPVIYVPLTIVLLSQNKFVEGIAMLVFCAVIVSNVDNLLRPKFIGERVGLHYMVTFFSLLGGILAYGPIGLMVGPCLASAVLCLVEIMRTIRRGGSPHVSAESTPNPEPV